MEYLLAQLYGLVVKLRLWLYRSGFLSTQTLEHPVISVGNLTVGGTGKTPFVMYLAQLLLRRGFQPVVLSRGYGGKAGRSHRVVSDGRRILCGPNESGDEPFLMARRLEGVPVLVGRNRYRSAQAPLLQKSSRQLVFLLDDGYQHLALQRDLNILLLDATDPFGGNHLLPRGRLREPLNGMRRADLVVITRAHRPLESETIQLTIRRLNPLVPISFFYHDGVAIYDLKNGRRFELRQFLNERVVVLAAIGNPAVFVDDLEHYQMRVVDQFLYRDHHRFSQSELDQALSRVDRLSARAVITTEKDAVRLEGLSFEKDQVLVFQIECRPENEKAYEEFLLSELKSLPNHG